MALGWVFAVEGGARVCVQRDGQGVMRGGRNESGWVGIGESLTGKEIKLMLAAICTFRSSASGLTIVTGSRAQLTGGLISWQFRDPSFLYCCFPLSTLEVKVDAKGDLAESALLATHTRLLMVVEPILTTLRWTMLLGHQMVEGHNLRLREWLGQPGFKTLLRGTTEVPSKE